MEGRISREFASFGIESAKLLFYPQNPVGQGEPCEDNSTIMLIVMFECFSQSEHKPGGWRTEWLWWWGEVGALVGVDTSLSTNVITLCTLFRKIKHWIEQESTGWTFLSFLGMT